MNLSTIMIIDDEPQMRKPIRMFLEKEGYTVVEATDGIHALSLIAYAAPQLLIFDVIMPYMDGFAFAHNLNKKYHNLMNCGSSTTYTYL